MSQQTQQPKENKIQVNNLYYAKNKSRVCCDEVQDVLYCKAHDEPQGCYFCEFDYTEPCICEEGK